MKDKIMTKKQHEILYRAARILALTGALVFLVAIVNFAIYLKAGATFSARMLLWAAAFVIAGLICTAVESAED